MYKLNLLLLASLAGMATQIDAGKKFTILQTLENEKSATCFYCNKPTGKSPYDIVERKRNGKVEICCFNCALLAIFPRQQRARL